MVIGPILDIEGCPLSVTAPRAEQLVGGGKPVANPG
jgi:hypothetical protein